MRADRLKISNDQFYLLTETSTQVIFQEIKTTARSRDHRFDTNASIATDRIRSRKRSQIRETVAEMQRFAKETNTPVFLIGHITKDGAIAGPKILEHMVDTVLQFEGDQHYAYRILRTIKNRFGSTAELGIYEMTGAGLRQVSNPSEILISQRDDMLSGVAIASTIEGAQADVGGSAGAGNTIRLRHSPAQRHRLRPSAQCRCLLLAVLENVAAFTLAVADVVLNIAGKKA